MVVGGSNLLGGGGVKSSEINIVGTDTWTPVSSEPIAKAYQQL